MVHWIEGAFALLIGAAFGSFANVLVVRLKDASSIWGRSRCVHCAHPIRSHHLVPILSWFFLHGQCPDCAKPIHWQYPIVEAVGALIGFVAFSRHDPLTDPRIASLFLFEFLFAMDLLVLVTFDLRWRLLPIEFMAGSGLVFALFRLISGVLTLREVAIGLAVGGGFLGIQVVLSRGRWMGFGDPWAGAMIGAALGWPMIAYAFYFTYIVGGFVALMLLATGILSRGTRIPFAPWLATGALCALWFGPLVHGYLSHVFGW